MDSETSKSLDKTKEVEVDRIFLKFDNELAYSEMKDNYQKYLDVIKGYPLKIAYINRLRRQEDLFIESKNKLIDFKSAINLANYYLDHAEKNKDPKYLIDCFSCTLKQYSKMNGKWSKNRWLQNQKDDITALLKQASSRLYMYDWLKHSEDKQFVGLDDFHEYCNSISDTMKVYKEFDQVRDSIDLVIVKLTNTLKECKRILGRIIAIPMCRDICVDKINELYVNLLKINRFPSINTPWIRYKTDEVKETMRIILHEFFESSDYRLWVNTLQVEQNEHLPTFVSYLNKLVELLDFSRDKTSIDEFYTAIHSVVSQLNMIVKNEKNKALIDSIRFLYKHAQKATQTTGDTTSNNSKGVFLDNYLTHINTFPLLSNTTCFTKERLPIRKTSEPVSLDFDSKYVAKELLHINKFYKRLTLDLLHNFHKETHKYPLVEIIQKLSTLSEWLKSFKNNSYLDESEFLSDKFEVEITKAKIIFNEKLSGLMLKDFLDRKLRFSDLNQKVVPLLEAFTLVTLKKYKDCVIQEKSKYSESLVNFDNVISDSNTCDLIDKQKKCMESNPSKQIEYFEKALDRVLLIHKNEFNVLRDYKVTDRTNLFDYIARLDRFSKISFNSNYYILFKNENKFTEATIMRFLICSFDKLNRGHTFILSKIFIACNYIKKKYSEYFVFKNVRITFNIFILEMITENIKTTFIENILLNIISLKVEN
ncbi:MAG: hypothetical protein KAH01_05040 [Caldisericia bacterium]|nr:hypothetical protein [Caldisericia bacterium]